MDRNKWRALVNSAVKFRITYNSGTLSSGYRSEGLSSSSQLRRISK
jgi:hypothetical protein